jgi:AraC family transcriptional regulator of adaptative response/methylated-DNA-[protein]-cysteine methyltransferase
MKIEEKNQDYDFCRIEKAIEFIENNFKSHPSLDQIAAAVNMSRFHFSRMFRRWAGITPMQFLHFLTAEYIAERLTAGRESILAASLSAGLSGPSRAHDLFINFYGITPGDYKKMGEGQIITCGFAETPFGECFVAAAEKGICRLGFITESGRQLHVDLLKKDWPHAIIRQDDAFAEITAGKIFSPAGKAAALNRQDIFVRGTNFQINVWKALLAIPEGSFASYSDVAESIGYPESVRAVANAVASNPVGYLIPCHRVITKSGKYHNYRWGSARKKAIIIMEAAKRENQL